MPSGVLICACQAWNSQVSWLSRVQLRACASRRSQSTLSPDGRDRPPHLRSFRDGWRHLRFMLMCSPGALFVVPGLLLVAVGLTSIPAVVLAGYGVFTNILGPNFMFTAAMIALVGYQLLIFGLLAKLYAHQIDPVFRDPLVRTLSRSVFARSGRHRRPVARPCRLASRPPDVD